MDSGYEAKQEETDGKLDSPKRDVGDKNNVKDKHSSPAAFLGVEELEMSTTAGLHALYFQYISGQIECLLGCSVGKLTIRKRQAMRAYQSNNN